MAPMSILLAALSLISVTLIEAPSHHVQGGERYHPGGIQLDGEFI